MFITRAREGERGRERAGKLLNFDQFVQLFTCDWDGVECRGNRTIYNSDIFDVIFFFLSETGRLLASETYVRRSRSRLSRSSQRDGLRKYHRVSKSKKQAVASSPAKKPSVEPAFFARPAANNVKRRSATNSDTSTRSSLWLTAISPTLSILDL